MPKINLNKIVSPSIVEDGFHKARVLNTFFPHPTSEILRIIKYPVLIPDKELINLVCILKQIKKREHRSIICINKKLKLI